jgi:aldose 1-epimerase
MVSIALDHLTPIMLAHYGYWNLGSFTTATILNDTLELPFAARTIATDSIQIPTGEINNVVYPWAAAGASPAPLNFTSPKKIGEGSNYSKQCGDGCTGIDNAFILDRPSPSAMSYSGGGTALGVADGLGNMDPYVLKWTSPDSGISMEVRTNQGGLQVYDCLGQNGKIGLKASQRQNGVQNLQKYGCLVMETQQWIDGINQPGWGVLDREIFGGEGVPAVNIVSYDFSVER